MSANQNDGDLTQRALLPAGLRDVLPPEAEYEASVVEGLVACLRRHGYRRVKPPLVEFESSLLSGPGVAMRESTFRLMDPVSQRMMGVRADMTVQAARIASTRLKNEARPMRLCYAGEILRVNPDQLVPERELQQIGAELIGSPLPTADAEVILLAVEALGSVGVDGLSVDITVPSLVPMVVSEIDGEGAMTVGLRAALDRKDAAGVREKAGKAADLLAQMMDAAGDADSALAKLDGMDLPRETAPVLDRVKTVVELIRTGNADVELTVDPIENRGYEYHTGIGFSLFRKGVRGELGRGGRYVVEGSTNEDSTGFSLYLETLIRALPGPGSVRRIFAPIGTGRTKARELQDEGWSVVAGLEPTKAPEAEAKRLGCSHCLVDGAPKEI